jgi:hypothetical protein
METKTTIKQKTALFFVSLGMYLWTFYRNGITECRKEALNAKRQNEKSKIALNIWGIVGLFLIPIAVLLLIYHFRVEIATVVFLFSCAVMGIISIKNKLSPAVQEYSSAEYYDTLAFEYMIEALSRYCNCNPDYHNVKEFENIADRSYWYDDVSFKFFVEKVQAATVDPEELKMLGYKIENRINNRLMNPYTCKIPSFDNFPPKIGVLSVIDNGGRIVMSVKIANSQERRQWLVNYRQQAKNSNDTPIADKSDKGLYDLDPNRKDVILRIGLMTELLHLGEREFAEINLTKSPHLAVVANSGGGKSYLLSQILQQISIMNGSIWLADFKNGGDYGDFDTNIHRYYSRQNYTKSIEDFDKLVNDKIINRGSENQDNSVCVLVLEEYGTFLNSLDKKQAEMTKKIVANLLFTARFLNCFVLICSQRLFAEQLLYGCRDSLTNVIMLADPSSESLQAFTSADERSEMKPHQQGEGYLIREGRKPLEITVTTISDHDRLKAAIAKAVTKNHNDYEEIDIY